MDLGLPIIPLILHMRYLNEHNKGQLFGYFIASSYSCPFLLALLLLQFPTLSYVAVAMILVCDTYFPADPFGSPTLPLLFVVAFLCCTFFGDAWARP